MPTLIYKTSREKWEGLARIARDYFKNEELARLCEGVVKRITEKGDARLNWTAVYEIDTLKNFRIAIHNHLDHPCPHCIEYMDDATGCSKCPLFDEDAVVCCHEWVEVKKYLNHQIFRREDTPYERIMRVFREGI